MSIETHPISEAISEDTSFRWRGTLVDADGVAIPSANVVSITASLVDGDGLPVNGRTNENVLNANGGSLDSNGVWTMQFTADDAQTPGIEKYHKRFWNAHVIYNSGELNHQVQFFIVNHVYV